MCVCVCVYEGAVATDSEKHDLHNNVYYKLYARKHECHAIIFTTPLSGEEIFAVILCILLNLFSRHSIRP